MTLLEANSVFELLFNCYIIDVLLVVVVFETFTPNITGKSYDTP